MNCTFAKILTVFANIFFAKSPVKRHHIGSYPVGRHTRMVSMLDKKIQPQTEIKELRHHDFCSKRELSYQNCTSHIFAKIFFYKNVFIFAKMSGKGQWSCTTELWSQSVQASTLALSTLLSFSLYLSPFSAPFDLVPTLTLKLILHSVAGRNCWVVYHKDQFWDHYCSTST